MTRTFLALELPDHVRAALDGEIARLSAQLHIQSWAKTEKLHLTLAFLGELDDAQLAAATDGAVEVAPMFKPFPLQLAGLGTFGPPRAPRVIWAGVGGDVARLLALQAQLVGALAACGFPREERPFSPHLTLARIKAPLPPAELARLPQLLAASGARARWTADALAVMKSELLRPAARYTRLARVPLGAGVVE
jgi:2'-5' RNA ligase